MHVGGIWHRQALACMHAGRKWHQVALAHGVHEGWYKKVCVMRCCMKKSVAHLGIHLVHGNVQRHQPFDYLCLADLYIALWPLETTGPRRVLQDVDEPGTGDHLRRKQVHNLKQHCMSQSLLQRRQG
jgi:hypothetical protein